MCSAATSHRSPEKWYPANTGKTTGKCSLPITQKLQATAKQNQVQLAGRRFPTNKALTFSALSHGWDLARARSYYLLGLLQHIPLLILVWQEHGNDVH